MKFERNDRIRHVKSGRDYMVLATPEHGVKLETTNKPGYLYQEFWRPIGGASIWVRDADEMQDGRFELVCHTSHGAYGRLPE